MLVLPSPPQRGEGNTYDQIMEITGLPRRTFYRYLNRVFAEDKKALQERNQEELMTQLCILRDRYNENYQLLRGIATDPKVSAYDRIHTLAAMKVLSDTIMKLHNDAPAFSIIQRRKLEGLEKGALYFENIKARLPPVFEWATPPPLLHTQQQDDNSYDKYRRQEEYHNDQAGGGGN
jgi:hypothetical protein